MGELQVHIEEQEYIILVFKCNFFRSKSAYFLPKIALAAL